MTKRELLLILCSLCLLVFSPGAFAQEEVVAGLGRDPGVQYGYGAHPPLTRVLESLVFKDLDLGLVPGLATHWEASDDALVWTFELRQDVRFHDGSPLDADAVVHNLKRLSSGWPTHFGKIDSIEALGSQTVRVTHQEPFAPFLYSLAWPGAAIISPDAIDADGNVTAPVGTGPFIREQWISDSRMVLVKNEDYWGGPAHLERVTLEIIPDATTRMMALEAGEIDMIIDTGGVLPEQVPTLLQHDDIAVMSVAGAVPHYLSLNTADGPLADRRVRQALMRAIDPESIVTYVLEGQGEVMTSLIPYSESEWMHPDTLYQFDDFARAVELLEEAGWEQVGASGIREKDGERFRLRFVLASSLTGRWPYQTIAEVIQYQLGQLGMDVRIEVLEAGLWTETLRQGDADLSIRPWAGVSPHTRLYDWLHSEGQNVTNMGIHLKSDTLDALIDRLMVTVEEHETLQLMYEIQEVAAQELPLIPIYDEVLINAARSHVHGYVLHPWFTVNWEDIYVEK